MEYLSLLHVEATRLKINRGLFSNVKLRVRNEVFPAQSGWQSNQATLPLAAETSPS